LDLNAKEEELFSFLKERYKSLESCKIIYDSYNNISKGFGFANFADFNEYNLILKNNEKLIFKGNELIIK
jgi:RNA recognition motif-containing protein